MPRRERPLEADGGVLSQFAADLRVLREKAGSTPYRELSKAAHYSPTVLSEAAGGRRLPSLAVTLAYVRSCGGDVEAWQGRWHAIAADLTEDQRTDEKAGPPPYAGLAAFQSTDADRFFGRGRLVDELRSRIGRHRFLGVFGASGSGKSSVLRAGLVPALEAGGHRVVLFSPGAHPLEECAVHLAAFLGDSAPSIRAELAADPANLHLRIRQAVHDRPGEPDLVIVIDQFEEVFALCGDGEERARFIDALVSATGEPTSRARVIIGVRADFYPHCTQHPRLVDALRDAQVMVGPMTADELREAIVAPAAQAGYTVETALVSRLVAEAAGQAAVLPLVSHALLETWRRRRGTRLTLDGYRETGGIQHAIARTAEQVYTDLDDAQRDLARALLLRLTAPGEGTEDTKRRVSRGELDPTENLETVLDKLAHARLVTLDNDGIEITHEALIRCWDRLRDWLAEDRVGLRVHRHLREATHAWESLDHDPGSLYRGTRLDMAREWAAAHDNLLTTRERRFLDASLAATRRHTRRLGRLVAMLAVLLLVATVTTIVATRAQLAATQQRNLAIAHKAATDAVTMRPDNAALAAQVSLAAYRLAPDQETRDHLLNTFATPFPSQLIGHTAEVRTTAFGAGGQVVATAGADQTARLWDVRDTHHPRPRAVLRHTEPLNGLALDAPGTTMATYGDTMLTLWDVTDPDQPRQLAKITSHAVGTLQVAFSPDGRTMASGHVDGTARLWDVTDRRQPRELAVWHAHTGWVNGVAFSPDGRTLATNGDQTGRLWDLGSPTQPRPLGVLEGHRDAVEDIAFSPNGKVVASSSWDHEVRLWDVTDPAAPRPLATLLQHEAIVWSLAFSPDGQTLATGDGTVRLWDLTDPSKPQIQASFPGGGYSVAFSPDGNTLSTPHGEQGAYLYDLREFPLFGHTNSVGTLALRPDGKLLATGSWDRTVRLWDITDPHVRRPLAKLTGQRNFIRAVAFSPDGTALATASDDGTARLWDVADPGHAQMISEVTRSPAELLAAAFSPDGRLLATTGLRAVILHDVSDRAHPREVARLGGYPAMVWSATFTPDGRTLVTDGGPTARLWDVTDPRTPRELPGLPGPTDRVPSTSVSPDGRLLATLPADNTVRLVDFTDPRRPRQTASLPGTDHVWAVAFSPDSHRLAVAGRDTRIWDISDPARPALTATLRGHPGDDASVAFSPDGRAIATGGNDATIRLWDTNAENVAARICGIAQPAITEPEWQRFFPGLDYQPPCPR